MSCSVYVVDSWQWRDMLAPDGRHKVRDLERAGAIHLDIEEAKLKAFDLNDRIITFVNDDWNPFMSPDHFWLIAVDENKDTIARCRMRGMGGVIVTYEQKWKIDELARAGLKVLRMPWTFDCATAEVHRPPTARRQGGVLVSGCLQRLVYPERARVGTICSQRKDCTYIMHPGNNLATAPHRFVGDAYLSEMANHDFTLVCRTKHDRMVAKYIEIAEVLSLPVGDCPSYMPEQMKKAMVNTEGRDAAWINGELDRLTVDRKEYNERVTLYAVEALHHYNANKIAREVIEGVMLP